MPQIPQGTVDLVRETSDILEIISQFVDLKQRGANYFGICPFHDENTASLVLHLQTNLSLLWL